MRVIYFTLNLFVFIWGTLCINGFREALKYNALGDYTEINIDINTLVSITILNTLLIMTNYNNIVSLLIFNNLVTTLLGAFNIYKYTTCNSNDICINFFAGERFYSYYSFYSVLPYVQFCMSVIINRELYKNCVKKTFIIENEPLV